MSMPGWLHLVGQPGQPGQPGLSGLAVLLGLAVQQDLWVLWVQHKLRI